MRIGTWLAVALVGWTFSAQAAPLKFEQVSADAKWVAHLDMDALRDSTMVQKAWKILMDKHGDKVEVGKAMIQAHIGLDPTKDVHGVTVYGPVLGKPDGVLVANADMDRAKLIEQVAKAPEHKVQPFRSYEIHTWLDAKKPGKEPVAGAFFNDKTLVLGANADMVQKALSVLDGSAASAAAQKSALASAEPPKGSVFAAAAIGIAEANLSVKSPIVKHCKHLKVCLGENDGQLFAAAELNTDDRETAALMKDALVGLRAMALLHSADKPEVVSLINKLQGKFDDNTINVNFRIPAEDAWKAVEHVAKEIGKHKAEIKTKIQAKIKVGN